MAIVLPGGSRASMMGTGLGEGLKTLLQHKMGQMVQARNRAQTAKGVEALLNVSPEKAQAIAGMDPTFFRQLERSRYTDYLNKTLESNGKPKTTTPKKTTLLSARKKTLKTLNSKNTEQTYNDLMNKGYTKLEIAVLMGSELTEPIAKYFLDKSKGNKNKARILARKYGYEI